MASILGDISTGVQTEAAAMVNAVRSNSFFLPRDSWTMPTINLPPSLTIPYVLTNTKIADGKEEKPDDKDVAIFLKENGIVISGNDSLDDRVACYLALQRTPEFWAKHHPLHPNTKRVKKWLWVHARFIAQAEELVEGFDALPTEGKPKSAAKKLYADFKKFVKKIDAHSEFENTQLFKFFMDEEKERKAKFGITEELGKLMEQHEDMKKTNEILSALKKLMEADGAVLSEGENVQDVIEKAKCLMHEYLEELKSHMDEEENLIVAVWLQLSSDQYRRYRTYLSWKYSVVY